MKLDDKLTFGKYSGKTIRELIRNKKGLYLMWCLLNVRGFRIEPLELEDVIRQRYMFQFMAVQRKTSSRSCNPRKQAY